MKRVVALVSLLVVLISFQYFFITVPSGATLVYADETLGGGTVGSDSSSGLKNPLGESDPRKIIGNVIKALLSVTGSLALAVFIFGGFTWVTSAGNQEKIKKGKDMILWAALGLFIIFASYALVNFVIGAATGGASNS
ncbi:MAG: hypothetical protein A3J59_01070 [Candidatus Buchananbacteria bacterium RIFCSPHIGHO2_02_FULL_56_16]|uniref:Uncharacterized protein n=1 Tax=Candidatus Buchananbacteria bacterium RIFCSPHIGHO2_02_FULL_56_16 TaxID=1797542 RepID=A0A1G1YIM3_9BACT|nr:MAG: hypothetical protein A3J59_01070 [Candidatus Buchananbacteria bacterium RIFCSPHIGHO2_02_FULL_56_16]